MQGPEQEPAIGVIGGSGLYEMEGLESVESHQLETPFGSPSDAIVSGMLGGRRVFFLPRHGVGHRLLPHEINHKANLWALRSLGVRWLISINAVGSLCEEMAPRDIVLPDQLIDRTGTQTRHTFFGRGIAAHVGFAEPYCEDLRRVVFQAAQPVVNTTLHNGGTYLCMNGPAFSTRAEARMHQQMGAQLIGMTNAPEARLAREAGIAAVSLALVTDYDCWKIEEEAVDVAVVIANMQANSALAKEIIRAAVPCIPGVPDSASHRALETAILTPREHWPEQTLRDLAPILDSIG